MQGSITIAYIGNGKSTNRYHLPYVLQLKDKFRVKTIWQRRESSEWDKISGICYTTDLNSLLQDTQINTVVVTIPPRLERQKGPSSLDTIRIIKTSDKRVLDEVHQEEKHARRRPSWHELDKLLILGRMALLES